MQFVKHVQLFLTIYVEQLKRKWKLLPLLLFFPLIVIGMMIVLLIAAFNPSEQDPLVLAVVDEDKSTETMMITEVLEESSQLGDYIDVLLLDRERAMTDLQNNQVSTIVSLPENFTAHLYEGTPVVIEVTGNERQMTESYIIYELLNSVMRHITTSQANILLINEYAKKTPMSDTLRSELISEEFMRSFLSVLGKDKIIAEHSVENIATASPVTYFTLSTFFLAMMIWIVSFYHFFHRSEDRSLRRRLRVYGVKELEGLIAKLLIVISMCIVTMLLALVALYKIGNFSFYWDDVYRIVFVTFLYIVCFTSILAFVETILSEARLRLLTYAIIAILFILLSGAVVPVLYFPEAVQQFLRFVPSYEWLYALQQILLHERFYIDVKPLFIITIIAILVFISSSLVKERRFR